MIQEKSILSDIKAVLFSPRLFFTVRFLELSSKRIYQMSFVCLFLGLCLGGFLPFIIAIFLENSFTIDATPYNLGLQNLGIKPDEFLEMLKLQKAYNILIMALSPLIAYMAPHLFGGSLFVSLKMLSRNTKSKLEFFPIMECSAISLCPMAFNAVPLVGPIIAPILVGAYLSMALKIKYELVGFMKIMSVLFAMYICFFLSSASLQMLAAPLAKILNF